MEQENPNSSSATSTPDSSVTTEETPAVTSTDATPDVQPSVESTPAAEASQPETAQSSESAPKLNSIVKGVISKQVRQMAFVILESGQEARINVSELTDLKDESGALPIGISIEAEVASTRSGIELSREYLSRARELDALEAAFTSQSPVEGRIRAVNKGGFEVRLGNINAFCPRSRFSQRREGNPKKQVGKVTIVIEQ